mgnify:FL=1|jgi:hypothetical protein
MTRTAHWFRGEKIPDKVKSKHDMVSWALQRHREGEPISNGEFIYDLNYSRFGSSIFNLRKAGWDIETVRSKKQGLAFYYLKELPTERDYRDAPQLSLVENE